MLSQNQLWIDRYKDRRWYEEVGETNLEVVEYFHMVAAMYVANTDFV